MIKNLKKNTKKIQNFFKKQNKVETNLLINSLFKSKNFYGESLNKTKKEILPFLYGVRHNYSIINLKNTAFILKRVFPLIKNIIKRKKKILIVANSEDIQFLINKNFTKNNNHIIYLNKECINGFITNPNISNKFNKKELQLILIIKSSINENYLNTELSSLQIPIISFLNTDQNLKQIHYPILMNSKNVKSLYMLMYLIRKLF